MNYYTPEEVADILKMKVTTIRKYLTQGDLKGMKIGRIWRISEEELKEFIEGKRN